MEEEGLGGGGEGTGEKRGGEKEVVLINIAIPNFTRLSKLVDRVDTEQ